MGLPLPPMLIATSSRQLDQKQSCDRNADAFDIATAYHGLYELYGSDTDIAVRNATAEDFPNASFAGQQEIYLNVHSIQGEWCPKILCRS